MKRAEFMREVTNVALTNEEEHLALYILQAQSKSASPSLRAHYWAELADELAALTHLAVGAVYTNDPKTRASVVSASAVQHAELLGRLTRYALKELRRAARGATL